MATGGMNAEPNLESFELQARDKDAQIISSMPGECSTRLINFPCMATPTYIHVGTVIAIDSAVPMHS